MTQDEMWIGRNWEVTFRPFPAVIVERGFEVIMSLLAKTLYAPEDADDAHPALRGWATPLVGSHGDHVIMISVDAEEGPPTPIQPEGPIIHGLGFDREYTKEHYQRALAAVIADLGLEGDLHVEEVVTVMVQSDLDEEDDDGDDSDH